MEMLRQLYHCQKIPMGKKGDRERGSQHNKGPYVPTRGALLATDAPYCAHVLVAPTRTGLWA